MKYICICCNLKIDENELPTMQTPTCPNCFAPLHEDNNPNTFIQKKQREIDEQTDLIEKLREALCDECYFRDCIEDCPHEDLMEKN